MHRAGFLHLDLSLANVMVVEVTITIAIAPAGASSSNDAGMLKKPAKKPRTVLIDFGLSDVVDAENGLSKISHGTPGSVPPEGHTTLSDVSERFSLGVVLLQVLFTYFYAEGRLSIDLRERWCVVFFLVDVSYNVEEYSYVFFNKC